MFVSGMGPVGSAGLSSSIKGSTRELPGDVLEGLIELSVLSVVGLGLALDAGACIGVEPSLFLLEYTYSG